MIDLCGLVVGRESKEGKEFLNSRHISDVPPPQGGPVVIHPLSKLFNCCYCKLGLGRKQGWREEVIDWVFTETVRDAAPSQAACVQGGQEIGQGLEGGFDCRSICTAR